MVQQKEENALTRRILRKDFYHLHNIDFNIYFIRTLRLCNRLLTCSSFCLRAIEVAYNKKSEEAKKKSNHFEIFIFNWRTMHEWGINGRPANRRPNITDLLDLCENINNIRASNYIRKNLLGRKSVFV